MVLVVGGRLLFQTAMAPRVPRPQPPPWPRRQPARRSWVQTCPRAPTCKAAARPGVKGLDFEDDVDSTTLPRMHKGPPSTSILLCYILAYSYVKQYISTIIVLYYMISCGSASPYSRCSQNLLPHLMPFEGVLSKSQELKANGRWKKQNKRGIKPQNDHWYKVGLGLV